MSEQTDDPQEDGILLIEGWMFGAAMFEAAMAEVIRVPPANDRDPPHAP